MEPKVLAHGIPGTTEEELGAPAAGKRWVVSAIYAANTTATSATITILHRIDATPTDRTLLEAGAVDANTSISFGPLVVEDGQSLRVEQGTADAIEVLVYGYEEDE